MKKISKRPNKNKELCIDVTTYLQSDRRMKAGKSYQGVLRRDVEADEYRYNETMTFIETCSEKCVKRNPHIFEGKHITVTQRDNGTYGLNFRDVHIEEPGFSVTQFATAVANELLWALEGLIEEVTVYGLK